MNPEPVTIQDMIKAHLEGLLWAFALSGMSYPEFEEVLRKRLIEDALAKNNYVVSRAARQLKMRRDRLAHRIRKLQIAMPVRIPKRRRGKRA